MPDVAGYTPVRGQLLTTKPRLTVPLEYGDQYDERHFRTERVPFPWMEYRPDRRGTHDHYSTSFRPDRSSYHIIDVVDAFILSVL